MVMAYKLLMNKSGFLFRLAGVGLLTFSSSLGSSLAQSVPPQAITPAVSTPNRSRVETDYTLGAGDRLRIDVFQVSELSVETFVLVDGTLNLPLIGPLKVDGLTIPEVITLLSQRYARYLKLPIVTASLLAPRPVKVAIAGEVQTPGTYTVPLETNAKFPTVTQIIQLAGGITTAADIGQVHIRRFFQGKEQLLTLNLWDLVQQGNLGQDITLRDGDTIFIPTQDRINVAQTRQLIDTNFGIQANQSITVAVVGEINRPGAYQARPLEGNNGKSQPPRLTQAIQLAGGIKPLADVRQVAIHRKTRTGAEQTIAVNLWELLQSGNISEDVFLQEGDTILIPKASEIEALELDTLASSNISPDKIRVNVVGEVKKPGLVEIPPNTPLNQALLTSGGFDERRANQDSVELLRLNPNGTVSKRTIALDFTSGISEEKNPILRNNDVVIVNRSGLAKVTDALGTILSPLGGVLAIFTIFR
jgi:polysaccharide export outer membrane protein